ncbi:MAG: glycosyltransferase family 2 protein, partial [Chitinivibrionales bacterium]|nr:glycosyltransferase family 2 protein [Chitinivibrionales bacterium]
TNSLLNLKYPEYELIVVNDGSKDDTITVLIEYYKLEKVDFLYPEAVPTRPVVGIYRNRSIPKLTVINKENGGKADSLNAGINCAKGDYVCGIDADSLLEQNALLKIAATTLDFDGETVAAGGNIIPINGCKVSSGTFLHRAIPSNTLAIFQMIEYFRAFMAGRLGWAFLRCLLIISGAFGLFARKRLIEIGGYLTQSGIYKRDTVGEDMELVVRLTRHMRQFRLPYRINYSHNANCWTEVPEKWSTLLRQRDRWHRGLIDILTLHRQMFFNRSYGSSGLIAYPYFIIFEMLGPWIELQGYCMVAGAAVFGLLNGSIALLLFFSSICMGTFVSAASLIIAQQELTYFRLKELLKLIAFSIIENFGFRQIMSFWRVVGYINMLRARHSWGAMERKGFAGKKKDESQRKAAQQPPAVGSERPSQSSIAMKNSSKKVPVLRHFLTII